MNFPQLAVSDVGIDLGGGDIGMTQKNLNRTDVSSVFQKVGGKTMAQSVRADFFGNAGFPGVIGNYSFYGAGGESRRL